MSLVLECGWGLARAGAVGILAVVLGTFIRTLLVRCSGRARGVLWLLLLVPYLTPVLLVGYGYSYFSLSLVHHPGWNQVLYGVLVWMKLVPLAAVILYFAPSFFLPEAYHCYRLLGQRAGGRQVLATLPFLMRGPGRVGAAAFVAVFLFAFTEFELASLLGIRTWTVVLFDTQAGGLKLSQSMRLALLPTLCEGGLLLLVMGILAGLRKQPAGTACRRTRVSRRRHILGWGYLIASPLAVTVIPILIVLRGTLEGFAGLVDNLPLLKDIAASVLFGIGAAAIAYLVSDWFVSRRSRFPFGLVLCIPGLLGPLVLSLLMLYLFQQPFLRKVYDTPAPLVITLALILFPFGLLVGILLRALRPTEALRAASLLASASSRAIRCRAGQVAREIKGEGKFWLVFLLFCWGYFDLTVSSLLAPAGMMPISVRLYNLMHYGQSAVLSAMVCLAFFVPLVLLCCVRAVRALVVRLITYE